MTRHQAAWVAVWVLVAAACCLLAVFVWGQVYELARVASVAAPGAPVTWLRALAAVIVAALTIAAVIGCRAERRQP